MPQKTTPQRLLGVGTLASVTAGLLAGIGARIIMRIVAVTAHLPTQFSVGGTVFILFIGMVNGLVVGCVLTCLARVLLDSPKASKYVPGPICRGLISGLLLLLLFGLPLFFTSTFPNPDITFGIPLLNKCLFAALIVLYGISLGVAEKVFDHCLPRKAASASS